MPDIADRIPEDWPVQPLGDFALARHLLHDDAIATCGTCGLTWNDGQVTSMTPAPSGRCPFEPFHDDAPVTVTVRLELSPLEAATLHHFIGTHMPVYHGAVTRDSLIDIRRRLLASLKDAGVLA